MTVESDRHCITCSDEGVPMRVIELREAGIVDAVDGTGSRNEVMADLVGDVAPGDTLLVHAGVALLRLDESRGAPA